jgi:hypothetical protein
MREPHPGPLVFTAQSKQYFYCRDAVCAFVFERGGIPLNPFRAFDFFLGDRVERDAIRKANDRLVLACDELWVFGQRLANGVLYEVSLAAKEGKPIRFWTIEEDPSRIREVHIDELQFEPEVRHLSGRPRQALIADLRLLLNSGRSSSVLSLDLR